MEIFEITTRAGSPPFYKLGVNRNEEVAMNWRDSMRPTDRMQVKTFRSMWKHFRRPENYRSHEEDFVEAIVRSDDDTRSKADPALIARWAARYDKISPRNNRCTASINLNTPKAYKPPFGARAVMEAVEKKKAVDKPRSGGRAAVARPAFQT